MSEEKTRLFFSGWPVGLLFRRRWRTNIQIHKMDRKVKILFICKKRNNSYGISYGLINSCNFVCNELRKHGILARTTTVVDNNCIDREVTLDQPTHVFIEALWVVPEKMEILVKIHPKIRWFVRIHSKIPFLANEGIAIDWLKRYHEISKKFPKRLFISANSRDIVDTFRDCFDITVIYHPNIYCPPEYTIEDCKPCDSEYINIGCFGAIRPMKNQLYQAMASIAFGNKIGKKIKFHINSDRTEQKGESVLTNIERCFEGTQHILVKHHWMDHQTFITLVREMDIGLQVSMSETFNIVAADFVSNGISMVGSKDISWLNFLYKAEPTNIDSIIWKLYIAYYGKYINLQMLNIIGLETYNVDSTMAWIESLMLI